MQDNSIQINPIYDSLTQTIHGNWNLSTYARIQKELRLEQSKLPPDVQQKNLLEVYNNRPPIPDDTIQQKNKSKIIGYAQSVVKTKSQYGVINPVHTYVDPRISMQAKKVSDEVWFQQKSNSIQQSKKLQRPQSGQSNNVEQIFEIHVKKIDIKPPALLEREKPLMQDHLVSPYIYIERLIKKNSEEASMKHPDIWDKSTNKKSRRINKQTTQQQDPSTLQKEKQDRGQFYLKNLKMKEFIFKFYKTIKKLLKEKHFNKIIYQNDSEDYDLNTLFKLWVKHKGLKMDLKANPQQFISKEEFIDFMMIIGLEPLRQNEAEEFFEYCHEMVATGGKEGKQMNEKGVIVPKWWKMFEEEQKDKQIAKDNFNDFV